MLDQWLTGTFYWHVAQLGIFIFWLNVEDQTALTGEKNNSAFLGLTVGKQSWGL